MRNIYQIIIIALLSLPILTPGSHANETEYEFTQKGMYYMFRGSFLVNAELDCVIDLIYNFNNLSEYICGVQSIERIQQGDGWYDVCFSYRKLLVFENISTWRRTLKADDHKIVFEMLSSKNNMKNMPDVLSSKGYYQFTKEKDLCRLSYFQECTLDSGFLSNVYIKQSKQEAIQFLHDLKKYIKRKCN